jgi:hypothetical protein
MMFFELNKFLGIRTDFVFRLLLVVYIKIQYFGIARKININLLKAKQT